MKKHIAMSNKEWLPNVIRERLVSLFELNARVLCFTITNNENHSRTLEQFGAS
ncbi:hypothetical protein ABE354_11380 [Brevibacillus laterosporus]|uniref:hypothetical protein n=1 Tax=Brevibacillus laterosporus TaxID=1465 RepID=UPI003D261A1C